MGRRKKLDLLHILAIQLLNRACCVNATYLSELLLPTMAGTNLLTTYQRVRRLLQQEQEHSNPSMPVPGTYLVHCALIGYTGNRDKLLMVVELYTGLLWLNVSRDLSHKDVAKGIDAAFKATSLRVEKSVGDASGQVLYETAKLDRKKIILTCFDTPLRTSTLKGERKTKSDCYPSVNRTTPYTDYVVRLRRELAEWHRGVDIQPLMLPDNFRDAEPLTLPGEFVVKNEWSRLTKDSWEWEGQLELKLCIQSWLSVYNSQSRETFPWTTEPVSPIDRLYQILARKQIGFRHKKPAPPDGEGRLPLQMNARKRRGELMTKADLTEKIQTVTGLTLKESAGILEDVFELIKKELEAGESLKLSGFGTFEVRSKKSRRGRNPQSGEAIEIAPRRVLSFKSSACLRQAINR